MAENINKIIDIFKGKDLFYVGGVVRDRIMGIESNDIDLATNVYPEDIISLCKINDVKYRYTENSIRHGTITIEDIEVTTFRKDVSTDGRNCSVEYAKTIEEDISRRDFTINAIAVNVFTGELIDPFNGLKDIKNNIVRSVGNPEDRLKEDTLRSLRAIRFANRFGFTIEDNLLDNIRYIDISNLSIERIRDEFMKILETRNDNYISLILHKIIPEFNVLNNLDGGDKHNETVDVHSLITMKNMMKVSYNPRSIFAALLHDIGKGFTFNNLIRKFKDHEKVGAENVKEIMDRMKFSNDDINYVHALVNNHMRWHFDTGSYKDTTSKTIRRAIKDLPDNIDIEEMITDLCLLSWADNQANLAKTVYRTETFEEYTKRKRIYDRAIKFVQQEPIIRVGSGLELNGHDLIEMGFIPGTIFNIILKDTEEKIFNEEIKNNKEDLKNYVETNFRDMKE